MTTKTKSRFPTLRAHLLAFAGAGLLMVGACGGKKKEKEVEVFPPSVTAPIGNEKVNTLPAVEPELEPIAPPVTEAIVAEPTVVPTTYKGLVAEGKQLLKAGDAEAALEMFSKATELKPYAYPKIQMARALLAMGEHDKARVSAEAAVDLDAASTFAWNTLGRVELAAGDIEAAVTSFEHALDNDEHNSYAWNNLGFALIELGRHEEAAEALENATSSASPTAYMWNNLGMAYEHLNLIAEARASYRQAADLGSEKAAANAARLEGVESLVIDNGIEGDASDGVEIDEPIEPSTGGESDGETEIDSDGEVEDLNDGIVDVEEIEDYDDEMTEEIEGC